jgi:glycosyltransferase involved in cell wall biosynthesis
MQILILGMHRSGTSILTRLVNMLGAYFGPDSIATAPNDENPKGFWERRDVRKLNDDLLFSVGADWHRIVDYDPGTVPADARSRFEQGARAVIAEMDRHRPWVLKEPRLCLNLPVWRPLLERPVCLIVVRDPVEIAHSLEARNRIPVPVGIAMTHAYYLRALRGSEGLPRAVVRHREMLRDPSGAVRRICDQLQAWGIPSLTIPPDEAVLAFVDPGLYRQRSTAEETGACLTQAQSAFFTALDAGDWPALEAAAAGPGPDAEQDLLRLFEADAAKAARIEELAAESRRLDWMLTGERAQLRQYDALISAVERDVLALRASRSWRLGHAAMSFGARLLGRGGRGSAFTTIFRKLETARALAHGKGRFEDTGAPGASSRDALRRPPHATPERPRHPVTVAVIAWDTGHNPLGRAYMLAEALAGRFNVLLLGPGFDRYGEDVWPPLRDARIPVVRLPGGDLPEFTRMLEGVAPRIAADVVIACKPRLPSQQLGLMMKAFRNRPLLLDVDDYELSFFENRAPLDLEGLRALADRPDIRLPYAEPWTRYAESLIPLADGLLVSNVALQGRFGGRMVPHARDETLFDPELFDRAAARTGFGFDPGDKVVLFLGTPRRHKGILEVARALNACGDPRYRLCVMGSFDDRNLERSLLEVGGDRVSLVPNQPFADLPRNLMIADLVCLFQDPSSEASQYQLPAKVIDALAMGVPVISTPMPPLQPLIDAGAVITADDQTLAATLARALEDSERLGREQRDRRPLFLREYSYCAIADTLEREILRMLDEGVSPLAPDALESLELQRSLGASPAPMPPAAAGRGAADAIDFVLFWKQNDGGLYGRRPDMLAKYLARHPGVGRVLVLDLPIAVEKLMGRQGGGGFTHDRRIFTETWLKRWGLRDDGGIARDVFLFSKDRSEPSRRVWNWPGEEDYAGFLRERFAELHIDPAEAVFLVYPKNEAIPDLIEQFRPRLVVADVVDDHRTWPGVTRDQADALTEHYRRVVNRADLVIANCEEVRRSMSAFGKEVALITNACETDPPPPMRDSPQARAFGALTGPKIGYVGNMEAKVDVDLLDFLARKEPGWQIVLIGSTHANPSMLELGRHRNVHFFGVVPYPEVRGWIARLDAAIIPHKATAQTRAMNPMKLYVYASAGVPVVSTRVENLHDLRDWVSIADSYQEFRSRLGASIERRRSGDLPPMRAQLEANSWAARVAQLWGLIEGRLSLDQGTPAARSAATGRTPREIRRRASSV